MQDGHILIITLVAISTLGITVGTVARAWAESRKRSATDPARWLDAIEVRLSRMEEMMETVAIEMERVAEGQRFTAKLLAERPAPAPQAVAPLSASQMENRLTTPH